MSRSAVFAIMISLLLLGTLALDFKIQPVKASGTISINADGSVDPPTAPISTTDNITYTFTDNIYDSSGISVQKSDIVVNGNGYVLNSKYEYGRGNYGFGLSNVNNVTIENISIRDFGYGIIIDNSNDNVILGNNITGSLMDGMWIDSSTNNSLYGNWIERNSYGISIFSPNNLVYGNWISNNWIGIRVGAPNINLTKNLFNSNNHQLSIEQESSDWRDYIDFIDSSNLIDGKPVYYLMNEKDLLITPATCPDIGYLGLVNCTNITIENLTLRSNGQGLMLANTNNSRVIHNNIESNGANVELSSSFDNTFSENNITDDEFFGALLMFSSNNRFYHNNFIFGPLSTGLYDLGSTANTWDDGYPSGGNYWSDYSGKDVFSGPYQNVTGSDGIGDTPYTLPRNIIDHYPLMQPLIGESFNVTSPYGLPTPSSGWFEDGTSITESVSSPIKPSGARYSGTRCVCTGWSGTGSVPASGTEPSVTFVISAPSTITWNWKTTNICDFDNNCKVDVRDVSTAAKAFGTAQSDSRWNPIADVTGPNGVPDGKVDIRDVAYVAHNFGWTATNP